jgi:hypothetical protein
MVNQPGQRQSWFMCSDEPPGSRSFQVAAEWGAALRSARDGVAPFARPLRATALGDAPEMATTRDSPDNSARACGGIVGSSPDVYAAAGDFARLGPGESVASLREAGSSVSGRFDETSILERQRSRHARHALRAIRDDSRLLQRRTEFTTYFVRCTDLQLRDLAISGGLEHSTIRSLCWKLFLGILPSRK